MKRNVLREMRKSTENINSRDLVQVRNRNMFSQTLLHFAQRVVDKYTKLSKMHVYMERFTTSFSQFSCINVKICFMGGRLSTCYHNT